MTVIQARDGAGGAWVLLLATLGTIGCGSDTANVGELADASRGSNSSSSDGSGGSEGFGVGGASSSTGSGDSIGGGNSTGDESVSTASTTAGPAPTMACGLGDAVDSRWVVFDSDGGTGETERRIYAVEAKGGTVPQPLTPQNVLAREPAVSPDGTELAYVADGIVRVLSLDSGDDAGLVEGDQPTWSPDGKGLAYHADRGVWLFDREDRSSTELVSCSDCSLGGYQNPEFSRDGKFLVMDRENRIELLELETGDMHRVVRNGTERITQPTLSPDGGSVLVAHICDQSWSSLWLYETGETTNPCEGRRFTPEGTYVISPSWGPNSVIAFEIANLELRVITLFDLVPNTGVRS